MHLPWTLLVHCINGNDIILAKHILLINFVSYQIWCRAICNKVLLTNHYNYFLQKKWRIIPYTKCMAFWQAQFWRWDSDLLWLRFNCTYSLSFYKFAITSYFCSFSFGNQCLLGRLMRKELMFTYKLILPNLNCCTKSTRWKKVTLNKTRKCQFLKRWEFWPWINEIINFLNPFHISL